MFNLKKNYTEYYMSIPNILQTHNCLKEIDEKYFITHNYEFLNY